LSQNEPATSAHYRRARRERLAAVMDRLGLGAIVLRRPANFAWYTGGADNRVSHADPVGVASVVVTPNTEYIVTTNIEARRMRDEETPDIPVVEHPWYEYMPPTLREVTGGAPVGTDYLYDGARDVAAEIAPLRYVLDPDAVAHYRQVGRDAVAAFDQAVAGLAPGMSEHEAVALVQAACWRRRLACPVVLAAADGRIARYRHPIAHGERIEQRALLVLCAERWGLYANLTRVVSFAPQDDELRWRQETCDTILQRMREEATVPGRTLADAFADCQRFYAEAGFPDEWKLHHQGGLSGYASREVIATPHTYQVIQVGQAFAWNPSITGTKAEETFVLTEAGPEVLCA
jgi:Xaa-Pro dipeptidase